MLNYPIIKTLFLKYNYILKSSAQVEKYLVLLPK